MLTPENIGRVLKEQREFLNISQQDVAHEAGISRDSLVRLESGQNQKCCIIVLSAVCEVLDMTLDDLAQWAEESE